MAEKIQRLSACGVLRRRFGTRRMRWAAAAALIVTTTACSTLGMLGRFLDPVVDFKNLRVTGLGLTGGSLEIVLGVYNPNGFSLNATRLTYQLVVDDVQFGQGALDSRFTVQAGDTTDVRIPLTFTYTGIGAAGRQIVSTGGVNYRVTGDLTVGTPLGNFTRPYTQNARFTVFGGTAR
jgi:LEA14-like dessication related protein